MYDNLKVRLQQKACPHCDTRGSLTILESQALIKCSKCFQQYVDPWSKGPWEQNTVDTFEDDVVSSYAFFAPPFEGELGLNDNFAEFVKSLNKDAAKRVIEPDEVIVNEGAPCEEKSAPTQE